MPADQGNLDLRTVLAQLDRLREETLKFTAEQHKLMAERSKLDAETRKLDRDRWLAPWLAIAGLLGGVLTIGVTVARAFHWIP
jgi:hypothetical protein